jgi:hypothetical protein
LHQVCFKQKKKKKKFFFFFYSDSRGGICEKPAKDIYEGQRVIKTLNTGMITVINHNTRTSALMTELTFAHEVGHSLGAEVLFRYFFFC